MIRLQNEVCLTFLSTFWDCCIVLCLSLQKEEKRVQHAMKETEFLRLKRSRLGVHDFEPLKVIGRGAFGEVSPQLKQGRLQASMHVSQLEKNSSKRTKDKRHDCVRDLAAEKRRSNFS